MTRLDLGGLAFAAVSLLAGGGVHAQDYPPYATRCATSEIVDATSLDCQAPFAHFGLSGPTALGSGELDVEATGSIAAPTPPEALSHQEGEVQD